MRYINLDQLQVPDGWKNRADAAIADGVERINNHSDIWRALKEPLKQLSHDKCYYCEVVNVRADGAVDHFRPKSKYPWSAFSWSNYRFSCTFCNSLRADRENGRSGGKGDLFPLLNEENRATCGVDELNESPILLDPCKPDDPGLIDFDETGSPIPTYSEETHAGRYNRAAVSIRLYHLDHADLVDRRKTLAASIKRKIDVANRLFPQTELGNPDIDAAFSEHLQFLASCIAVNAELSVFARRILAGYRNFRWVDMLLHSA